MLLDSTRYMHNRCGYLDTAVDPEGEQDRYICRLPKLRKALEGVIHK